VNFADALAQTAPKKGPSCSVGKLIATLDKKAVADVQAALANTEIQSAHLARALGLLTESGKELDSGAVRRHRSGGCNCQGA
jgi:hypothetical protein